MNAEIITIGDEIITGHTIDTNAAFIAKALGSIGVEVTYRSSVGDSIEHMEEAFRLALKRTKVVITTGGLGPTDDDITKKAIVKVFRRNLIFHEEVLKDLQERFAKRGIKLPAINQNQALLPQGATFLPNKSGSAVGICLAEKGRVFIALPGVPFEMEQIMIDEVIPYLEKIVTGKGTSVKLLRTTGIMESKLAELLAVDLRTELGVRLAYLPSARGVDLRILASGENNEEAKQKSNTLVRHIESKVGRYIYGQDTDTLESVIGQLLIDNDQTLAVAESCTGGELGKTITSVSGASKYFIGGLITYADSAKIDLLSVSKSLLEKHGAVSQECAKAMADGCRKKFDSDYALSITGIAGPEGGSEEKPVGTTFIGLSSRNETYAIQFNFGTLREINRTRAVSSALETLRRYILDIR